MKKADTNLFSRAIARDELLEFATGQGEYFIVDREWGDHWVLGAWRNHILPHSATADDGASSLKKMFSLLLNAEMKPAAKMYCILYHLYVYYLFRRGRRIGFFMLPASLEKRIVEWMKSNEAVLHSSHSSNIVEQPEKLRELIQGIQANRGLVGYEITGR